MPRAALLFVIVGLFATAWSNDPGLAAAPRKPAVMRTLPSPPTPSEERPEDLRPLAERDAQCTWITGTRRRHPAVR